jgi:hypothetical protein
MKCWKAGSPTAVSTSAIGAAPRPATRQAIAVAPAMVGTSHSIGHTVRISRSAKAASVNRPNSHNIPASPASISRDQWVS